jgi:hypothetical protein
MKHNPLDRIRSISTQTVESGDNCYSIVVIGRSGTHLVLPYSHLRGSIAELGKCVLMHSLAVVTVIGPYDIIEEITRLVSRQRLAAIRYGVASLSITIELEDSSEESTSR